MPLPTLEPTPRPTLDARALQAYGALLYLDGRSVWEGWGLVSDRLIAELPFEEIAAAQLTGNRLWMLADGRLTVVDLASGAVEDAHSGELREIAPAHSDQFPRPVMISPDGQALLMSSLPYDLVDVQTGERFSTTLPPLALILDWRMSDVQ